jgi:4-hydroxy-3-polyprenylbenzoate decarboxylase
MSNEDTHKRPGETQREWGRPIRMEAEVERRVAALVAQITKPAA